MVIKIRADAAEIINRLHKETRIPITHIASDFIVNNHKTQPKPKKETTTEGYQDFMKLYSDWFKHSFGVPPKIKVYDGKALKELIAYLKSINKGDIQKALELFQHILQRWGEQDAFIQKQTSLSQINSNINNIITGFKIKKNKYGQIAEDTERNPYRQ